MRTDLLAAPVIGLEDALGAVDAFDHALTGGLLRPQPDQVAGLYALADAVVGSPLDERVGEAAEKAATGNAGEEDFAALAAARAALLGAAHDALVTRIDEANGRTRAAWPAPPPGPPHAPNLRAAVRSWLADVARSGWRGLDHELVAAGGQTITAMLPDLQLRRLSALLDGFAAELAASCPGATLERIPARRWADLWSRAVLLAQPAAADADSAAAASVTGRLLPLGVDLHEHATAAQAQVHAVFEPADGGPARLVRAGVCAPKPDTVVGAGVWQLLRPHLPLLAAFSEGRAMELTGMPLTPAGDLLWSDEHARPGEPAAPFATARVALATAAGPPVAPLDRHPALIAEPVLLEGYKVSDADAQRLSIGGCEFDVALDRLPPAGPLTPKLIAASSACIALLRWEAGGFVVQPLAVEAPVKRVTTAVHGGAWAGGTTDTAGVKAEKAAAESVAVLRERAGRLLRK